jgi:transcriptional regulator with XRE-family HTH domain
MRTKLSFALKEALTNRGISYRSAAKQLNVEEGTLRQWFNRNRFPPDVLGPLAHLASITTGDDQSLKEGYEFELSKSKRDPARSVPANLAAGDKSGLQQALQFLDDRFEALDPSGRLWEGFAHDVENVFGSMGEDDVFIYWAIDQPPFEMDEGGSSARRQVASAVHKGAYFLYIYPDEDTLATLIESGLKQLDLKSPVEKLFEQFKVFLANALADVDGGDLDQSVEVINQRVIKLRAAGPAFASPNHRYVLFIPHGGKERGFARFPTGTHLIPKELQLSLHATATQRLKSFARASLQKTRKAHAGNATEKLALDRLDGLLER